MSEQPTPSPSEWSVASKWIMLAITVAVTFAIQFTMNTTVSYLQEPVVTLAYSQISADDADYLTLRIQNFGGTAMDELVLVTPRVHISDATASIPLVISEKEEFHHRDDQSIIAISDIPAHTGSTVLFPLHDRALEVAISAINGPELGVTVVPESGLQTRFSLAVKGALVETIGMTLLIGIATFFLLTYLSDSTRKVYKKTAEAREAIDKLQEQADEAQEKMQLMTKETEARVDKVWKSQIRLKLWMNRVTRAAQTENNFWRRTIGAFLAKGGTRDVDLFRVVRDGLKTHPAGAAIESLEAIERVIDDDSTKDLGLLGDDVESG